MLCYVPDFDYSPNDIHMPGATSVNEITHFTKFWNSPCTHMGSNTAPVLVLTKQPYMPRLPWLSESGTMFGSGESTKRKLPRKTNTKRIKYWNNNGSGVINRGSSGSSRASGIKITRKGKIMHRADSIPTASTFMIHVERLSLYACFTS